MKSKKVKLFCIPFAGGSAMAYKKWNRFLSPVIELCPLELAGRGYRSNEPFYESINAAVDDLLNSLLGGIKPETYYAIFGHSMGSVIAYELYYRLLKLNSNMPIRIFFSGRIAPTNIISYDNTYLLNDKDFKNELIRIGGTSEEIFSNSDLANYFLPIIRADYKMIGKHAYNIKKTKMECDISILNGKDDVTLKNDNIGLWNDTTNKTCSYHCFEGGHFYLNNNVEEVVSIINNQLISDINNLKLL